MLKEPIYIQSYASISALGTDKEEIWNSYLTNNHLFTKMNISELACFVSKIDQDKEVELYKILDSDSKYKHIDRSVLLALFVSRKAILESTKTSFHFYFSCNNTRQYFKLGFS